MGMIIGSLIGGYLPVLFGVSPFSMVSIITGFIGAFLGIWAAYKIGQSIY